MPPVKKGDPQETADQGPFIRQKVDPIKENKTSVIWRISYKLDIVYNMLLAQLSSVISSKQFKYSGLSLGRQETKLCFKESA